MRHGDDALLLAQGSVLGVWDKQIVYIFLEDGVGIRVFVSPTVSMRFVAVTNP